MHNPPHPGEALRTLCLEPLNLTVTKAARSLGVSRKTLSGIVNGRANISPEMAVRLSIAFDTSAESWLNPATAVRPLAYREKAEAAPRNKTECRLTLATVYRSLHCGWAAQPSAIDGGERRRIPVVYEDASHNAASGLVRVADLSPSGTSSGTGTCAHPADLVNLSAVATGSKILVRVFDLCASAPRRRARTSPA